MLDLEIIPETFRIMSQCTRGRVLEDEQADTHGVLSYLYDPHRAADEWILASEAERVALRAAADARLAAVIKENARFIRSREEELKAKREWAAEWRRRHPELDKARQKSWRDANREYLRQCQREYRAAIKSDPVKYAQYLEKNRLRLRAYHAKIREANPPKPKQTAEERKLAKIEWMREYRKGRCPPRHLTEAQVIARRAAQREREREHRTDKNWVEARNAKKRLAYLKQKDRHD